MDGKAASIINCAEVSAVDGEALVSLEVIIHPPDIYSDGLSTGELHTVAGASLTFAFQWKAPCDYQFFCQAFDLFVDAIRLANVGRPSSECDQSVCVSFNEIRLPEILSPTSLDVRSQGGDIIQVIVANLVSVDHSIWIGRVKVVSNSADWGSNKKVSFAVPKLEQAPCSECGRACKCTSVVGIYDSATPATKSNRKAELRLNYISPVTGPPILLAHSHGCAVKPCTSISVAIGRTVDVKITLGHFPMIPQPFVKCVTVGMRCLGKDGYVSPVHISASRGGVASITILSSSALETRLSITYTAPNEVPLGGAVNIFISYDYLPSVHLFLPVSEGNPIPAILSYFPSRILQREAVVGTITVKISNWIAGMYLSGSTAVCTESGSQAESICHITVLHESMASAVLACSFGTLPTPCTYHLNLQVSRDSDSWELSMPVDVLDACFVSSVIPSSATTAGGRRMKIVLDYFPIVATVTDIQVQISASGESESRSVVDIAILWSSDEGVSIHFASLKCERYCHVCNKRSLTTCFVAGENGQPGSTGLVVSSPPDLRPGAHSILIVHSTGASARGHILITNPHIDVSDMIPVQGGVSSLLVLSGVPLDESSFEIQVAIMPEGLERHVLSHSKEIQGDQMLIKIMPPSMPRAEDVPGKVNFINKTSSLIDVWQSRRFTLHYFETPRGYILPSRASIMGATTVTIYVRDTFFRPSQLQDTPLVKFGQSQAQVLWMSSGAEVLELEVEVPSCKRARAIEVSVVCGSMMTDGVPDAAVTANIEFEYFAPAARVRSILPSRWNVQGENSVLVALQYFPTIESLSSVAVQVGNKAASVTDVIFSDATETMIMLDVPELHLESRHGSVTYEGITASFAFEVYDDRVLISCQRDVSEHGCVGLVQGGDVLLVSVNFENVSSPHQLSVHLFGIPAKVVQLMESEPSLATVRVQVPRADGNILTTSVGELVVINTQVDARGPTRAVTNFTYIVSPSLTSAFLNHDNSGVKLYFDADTDGNNICDQLFDDVILAVFGIGANCFWNDRRTLRVQFGLPNEDAQPLNKMSIIHIKAGGIRDLHGLAALEHETKRRAMLQLHPKMQIHLHVAGPSSIGPCDDATFRASSNFWGILTYAWSSPSCEGGDASIHSLCLKLASSTSDLLQLQSDLLREYGEYKFQVIASSPVGIASHAVEFAIIKSPIPVPQVLISGQEFYNSFDDVLISAITGIPTDPMSPWLGMCANIEAKSIVI